MGVSAEWDERFLTDGRVLRDFVMKCKQSDGRNAVLQDGAVRVLVVWHIAIVLRIVWHIAIVLRIVWHIAIVLRIVWHIAVMLHTMWHIAVNDTLFGTFQ